MSTTDGDALVLRVIMELETRQETSQAPNVGSSLSLSYNGVRVVVVAAVLVPFATVAVVLRSYCAFMRGS